MLCADSISTCCGLADGSAGAVQHARQSSGPASADTPDPSAWFGFISPRMRMVLVLVEHGVDGVEDALGGGKGILGLADVCTFAQP